MNPRGLRRLFRDRVRTEDMPFYGRVEDESVYFLTGSNAMRIPTPPTMKNHGNYVASLSQLGRWLAEQAEEAGAMILPETAATRLLVSDGRVRGVRTGDRGRSRDGKPLPNFEPGSDLVGRVTVLCEGTQGHLTGAAIDHFALEGENPQVWALGVKEVWKVDRPLRRVIHTMGWPLRGRAKYREFGGSFVYPMGDDMVTLGMVVGLDYRDVELSPHDLLQELKTHRLIRKILRGGERIGWGAKTIPEGGSCRCRAAARARPAALRRRRRARQRAGAEGDPLRDRVRPLGRGDGVRGARRRGQAVGRRGALQGYDDALRESFVWSDLREVRNMRQAFGHGFWIGGGLASAMTVGGGRFPPGDIRQRARRGAGADPHEPLRRLPGAERPAHLRQALLGLPLRQQDAGRHAEPHPRPAARAAGTRRSCGTTCARPRSTRSAPTRATARWSSR